MLAVAGDEGVDELGPSAACTEHGVDRVDARAAPGTGPVDGHQPSRWVPAGSGPPEFDVDQRLRHVLAEVEDVELGLQAVVDGPDPIGDLRRGVFERPQAVDVGAAPTACV